MKNNDKILLNTSLLFILYLLLFLILGRILFPNGDEADWDRRTIWYYDLLNSSDFFSQFIENLDLKRRCFDESYNNGMKNYSLIPGLKNKTIGDFFSIFSSLNIIYCVDTFLQNIKRLSVTIILFLPLLFFIVYRNFFSFLLSKFSKVLDKIEFNNRIEVASYSILFPSIIYHVGLFSHEQITYIYLFLFFIFFNYKWLAFFISLVIFTIDNGMGIFLIFLCSFNLIIEFLKKYFDTLKLIILSLIILITLYFFSNQIILFLLSLGMEFDLPIIGDKIRNTYVEYNYAIGLGYMDKYSLILRFPQIFFGVVFTTPSFIKSILLYLLVFIFLIKVIIEIFLNKERLFKNLFFKKDFTAIISTIFVILCIIIIFPTHSNGRYYLILIPQLYMLSSYVFALNKLFIFSVFSSLIVFFTLSLYYVV